MTVEKACAILQDQYGAQSEYVQALQGVVEEQGRRLQALEDILRRYIVAQNMVNEGMSGILRDQEQRLKALELVSHVHHGSGPAKVQA